jgi:hypothetical protein
MQGLSIGVGREPARAWFAREFANRRLPRLRSVPRRRRAQHQRLVTTADVGLITKHEAFTIPDLPPRLLGHWAPGLPVLAAVDDATDLGPAFIDRYGGGLCVRMGDVAAAARTLRSLRADRGAARAIAEAGEAAVRQEFTAAKAASRLMPQLQGRLDA